MQVKLISRQDKGLLQVSLAMGILRSRNTVKIIALFLDCIIKGMTEGCGRSTPCIYWIEMGQHLPHCSCLKESTERLRRSLGVSYTAALNGDDVRASPVLSLPAARSCAGEPWHLRQLHRMELTLKLGSCPELGWAL